MRIGNSGAGYMRQNKKKYSYKHMSKNDFSPANDHFLFCFMLLIINNKILINKKKRIIK